MANQIRLKRASGSDPGASDLVLGEPAVRTDTGEIFLKKDDGSIAKVAGGIDDGDKGDITVSNDGATFTIDSGVIDNANVASNAAIAGSKINPSFGNQAVTSTNSIKLDGSVGDTIIKASGAEIEFTRGASSNITCSDSSGSLNINTGGANTRMNIASNGNVGIATTSAGGKLAILSNSSTYEGLELQTPSGDGSGEFHIGVHQSGATSGRSIVFKRGGSDGMDSESLRIDSSGNVGINEASPSTALDVNGTITCDDVVTAGALLHEGDTNTLVHFDANDQISLKTNGSTRLQVTNSGAAVTGVITSTGDLTITNESPKINFTDSGNNPDYNIGNINGAFRFRDDTNGVTRMQINTDGHVDINGNLDVGAGLDVTGDISVSGTVDGRDLATDGTKLDGIASGATNVTNTNQLTNGAGFITATLTNEQVQDIVGGMVSGNTESGITVTYQDGDGTLDFSVTSQTDNNFTNADHSKLDGIEAGATADQTASEILTLLKTVDGAGSGLDADTLDGISSGSFLRSDAADSSSEDITINGLKVGEWSAASSYKGIFHSSQSGSEYMIISNDTHTFISATSGSNVYIRNGNNDSTNQLVVGAGNDALTWRGNKVFHAGNDGAGSGLDADTLDGVSSGEFLRSNAADTANSDITFNGGAGAATIAAHSDISFTNGNWTGNHTKIQHHSNRLYIVGGSDGIFFREDGTDRWRIDGGGNFDPGSDSTYDIGASGTRVRVGYFDEVDSAEVRVNNGILETKAAIATSHTLTADYNALAVSPTINNGVTITVPSGAVWAIV